MKSKLLLIMTAFILLSGMLPETVVSAAGTEVWVLVKTHFEPQNQSRVWEQQFLDSVTTQSVTLSDYEFTYKQQVKKSGVTTVDAVFEFKFDRFPEELAPGDTAKIGYTGSSAGKGDVLEKTLSLYAQEWTNDNIKKSTLAETTLKLDGIADQDSKTLEFVIPETFDGQLIITT